MGSGWSVALLALVVAACDGGQPDHRPTPRPRAVRPAAPERPPPAVVPIATQEPLPDGGHYRLWRFPIDLSRARFDVVDTGFDRSLGDVRAAEGASLVVNGGYWDPDRQPEGLTVVGGRTVVSFDADLGGGVLVIHDGRARLLDAEEGAPDLPADVDFAQQCMPRLVVDGEVNVRAARPRADRTALCLRDGGRTLEVILARTADPHRGRRGPTLHALAEKLVELGCEQALNLDGGSSTGIAWMDPTGPRELPTRVAVKLAMAVHLSP